MAELSRNPWVLYPGDVGLEFHPTPTFIHSIVWSRYSDTNHLCRVLDARGSEVFNANGASDFSLVEVSPGCNPIYGPLTLDQLDSGVLQIFIK